MLFSVRTFVVLDLVLVGVWGVPAVMVAGWLFWGRREELKAETKKFLGIADEE